MQQIPVEDLNDSITEVVLDGSPYFLRLTWNSEDAYWAWGLEAPNNTVLVRGMKLVPDSVLLKWVRRRGFPPGELIAVTPDRRDTISREALPSGEVALVYVREDEI